LILGSQVTAVASRNASVLLRGTSLGLVSSRSTRRRKWVVHGHLRKGGEESVSVSVVTIWKKERLTSKKSIPCPSAFEAGRTPFGRDANGIVLILLANLEASCSSVMYGSAIEGRLLTRVRVTGLRMVMATMSSEGDVALMLRRVAVVADT
jgi:hypothetical protein